MGRGCTLVKGICGDYFNVVGLPVARLIKELKKTINDSTYQIEVNSTKKIKNLFKDVEVIDENNFIIKPQKEEINLMLSKLISNDIQVYGLHQKRASLEEVFIQKNGGNIIE